jgi:hypothetical protein
VIAHRLRDDGRARGLVPGRAAVEDQPDDGDRQSGDEDRSQEAGPSIESGRSCRAIPRPAGLGHPGEASLQRLRRDTARKSALEEIVERQLGSLQPGARRTSGEMGSQGPLSRRREPVPAKVDEKVSGIRAVHERPCLL